MPKPVKTDRDVTTLSFSEADLRNMAEADYNEGQDPADQITIPNQAVLTVTEDAQGFDFKLTWEN